MKKDRDRGHTPRDESSSAPFRRSGSGADYDPNSNWAAERQRDGPSGGIVPGIEGAPSGAGDGGFGPEGDYRGAAGQPNADVLGEVHGDNSELIDEAQELGKPKPDREFIGGSEEDENATRRGKPGSSR